MEETSSLRQQRLKWTVESANAALWVSSSLFRTDGRLAAASDLRSSSSVRPVSLSVEPKNKNCCARGARFNPSCNVRTAGGNTDVAANVSAYHQFVDMSEDVA